MQVCTADGTPLRGDLITRVILRTDLTPIPSTVEVGALATRETLAALRQGSTIRVGPSQVEYEITLAQDAPEGFEQGGRESKPLKVIGMLKSCVALGRRLQRAVYREGSTWSDIYRSLGATAQIGSDIPVPRFGAFVGMYPTPEVARVLQEEAAVVYLGNGKLHFRRLTDLLAAPADVTWKTDHCEFIGREFMEKHSIPFTVTTTDDGKIITSGKDASRGITMLPRGDQRILKNMGTVLVQRRKTREALSPTFNAGMRVDIAGVRNVVITAAHVKIAATEDGGGDEYTQLWLGELTQ